MKYVVYTEDPPLNEDEVATGLSRVNRHIIRAMGDCYVGTVAADLSLRNIKENKKIDPYIRNTVFKVSHTMGIFCKFRNVISKFTKTRFMYSKSSEKRIFDFVKVVGGNAVFAPIGTNVNALFRLTALFASTNLRLYVYLVDEPIAAAALAGNPMAASEIEKFYSELNKCEKIFCITAGLSGQIQPQCNIPVETLNLPYNKASYSDEEIVRPKKYIIFIGNASHFYQDGIIDCIDIIDKKVSDEGCDLKFVFTIDSPFVKKLQKEYGYEIVRIIRCYTQNQLLLLIKNAEFAYVSYSFREKYKSMVQTSYPSKLIEYFSSARKILLYSPDYAAASLTFRNQGFPFLVCNESKELLKQKLLEAILDSNDYSGIYNKYIDEEHGYLKFKRTLGG